MNYTERLVLGSVPRVDLETFQELYENLLRNNYEIKVLKDVAAKGRNSIIEQDNLHLKNR